MYLIFPRGFLSLLALFCFFVADDALFVCRSAQLLQTVCVLCAGGDESITYIAAAAAAAA